MIEPLDHKKKDDIKSSDPAKILNTVLLFLPFAIILYAIWSLWHDIENTASPWLPEYTPYYINGVLINFTILQSLGVLPALAFRFTRHYILSSAFIILFLLAASIFKHTLNLYPHVFKLLN